MPLNISVIEFNCCLSILQGVFELSQLFEASCPVWVEYTLRIVLGLSLIPNVYNGFAVALDCYFVIVILEGEVALLLPVLGRTNGELLLLFFLFLLGLLLFLFVRFTPVRAGEGRSSLLLLLLFYAWCGCTLSLLFFLTRAEQRMHKRVAEEVRETTEQPSKRVLLLLRWRLGGHAESPKHSAQKKSRIVYLIYSQKSKV